MAVRRQDAKMASADSDLVDVCRYHEYTAQWLGMNYLLRTVERTLSAPIRQWLPTIRKGQFSVYFTTQLGCCPNVAKVVHCE